MEHKNEKSTRQIIMVDILFTLLPIFILIFIQLNNFNIKNFLTMSEWSYISIIFFGQTIIRLFKGISKNQNNKDSSSLVLTITYIICLGLIPSCIILCLLELNNSVNILIYILQLLLIVSSIVIYFIWGSIGQILEDNKRISEDDFK